MLGRANQACAARADDVYLVVTGIPLCVKRDGRAPSSRFCETHQERPSIYSEPETLCYNALGGL